MIVDVYDLTGALTRSRYDVANDGEACSLQERVMISDVLIVPDSTVCRNQLPYLQERKNPILRDLVAADGRFDYKQVCFVGDILREEKKEDKYLEDFFKALHASSYVDKVTLADKNVILIPDNFSAEYQEKILRNCGLPRNCTILLWRSVAACLGNMEQLCKQGVEEDMEIYIVDEQQSYADISILKIAEDNGILVPQRKAYKHDAFYPRHNEVSASAKFLPNNEFYRYTYHGAPGNHIVWDKEQQEYRELEFVSLPCKHYKRLDELCWKADVVLSIGATYKLPYGWGGIYHCDAQGGSLSDGAALFEARRLAGKPTYFDECTGLYIVVQDLDNEIIYAKELIPANEKCKGGEMICGIVNDDCFIQAGTDNVRFLLAEEKGDDILLKELDYQFGCGCVKNQEPLKLYPSIIPGQGIAKVRVIGEQQLCEPVELDLLNMQWAQKAEGSINILNEKIKRSFPVDIPGIVADGKMWAKILPNVERYLSDAAYRDGKMFLNRRYLTPKSTGLDRLKRCHVFGNAEGAEYPCSLRRFNFYELFDYMADDFKQLYHAGNEAMYDVAAMIAYTYKSDYHSFRFVKKIILQRAEYAALNSEPINYSLMIACSGLLQEPNELRRFFKAYMRKIRDIVDGNSVELILKRIRCNERYRHFPYADGGQGELAFQRRSVLKSIRTKVMIPDLNGAMWWNLAMYELLIASPQMLKECSVDDCHECMELLSTMLISHYLYEKSTLSCSVLKVMLFMLKKRKYDKRFLRDEVLTRKSVEDVLTVLHTDVNQMVSGWSKIVLDFVRGCGSLEDLPTVMN